MHVGFHIKVGAQFCRTFFFMVDVQYNKLQLTCHQNACFVHSQFCGKLLQQCNGVCSIAGSANCLICNSHQESSVTSIQCNSAKRLCLKLANTKNGYSKKCHEEIRMQNTIVSATTTVLCKSLESLEVLHESIKIGSVPESCLLQSSTC